MDEAPGHSGPTRQPLHAIAECAGKPRWAACPRGAFFFLFSTTAATKQKNKIRPSNVAIKRCCESLRRA
ncbi:MAG TPA: hypothetical protein VEA17_09400, partial [Bordetella sp.]|nr:hypothetical protein [Bordetella sp.]